MERPAPWRQSPPEGPEGERLRKMLDEAAEVPEWPTSGKIRGWWRISEASNAPKKRRPLVFAGAAFAAVLLVTATAGWMLRGTIDAPPTPQFAEQLLPGGDLLKAAQGTQYSVDDVANGGKARTVRLTSGSLVAQLQPRTQDESFTVVTPHLTATVVATRFLVEVVDGRTFIVAYDGEARVRSQNGNTVVLHPNERLASDDARLSAVTKPPEKFRLNNENLPEVKFRLPRSMTAGAAPKTSCDAKTGAGRDDCLSQAAKGQGLAAQTALYALALGREQAGADARADYEAYAARFPNGVFAPEVSLALIDTYARFGPPNAALAQADAFLAHFGNDARAGDVAKWRAAYAEQLKGIR